MTQGRHAGGLVVLLLCMVGCADLQDFQINARNRQWAQISWEESGQPLCKGVFERDFKNGYVKGFLNVAAGGDGCVPLLPPQKYWSPRYQNPRGRSQVAAWFEGYRAGVVQAEWDGVPEWIEIPVSRYCRYPKGTCPPHSQWGKGGHCGCSTPSGQVEVRGPDDPPLFKDEEDEEADSEAGFFGRLKDFKESFVPRTPERSSLPGTNTKSGRSNMTPPMNPGPSDELPLPSPSVTPTPPATGQFIPTTSLEPESAFVVENNRPTPAQPMPKPILPEGEEPMESRDAKVIITTSHQAPFGIPQSPTALVKPKPRTQMSAEPGKVEIKASSTKLVSNLPLPKPTNINAHLLGAGYTTPALDHQGYTLATQPSTQSQPRANSGNSKNPSRWKYWGQSPQATQYQESSNQNSNPFWQYQQPTSTSDNYGNRQVSVENSNTVPVRSAMPREVSP